MNLTDLYSVTPAMAKASAQLSRQVQKATVAAAKEPRLNLRVLGISIGQKQSTGDTSKPSLPWQNKAFMESTSAKTTIELLKHMHEEIHDSPFHLPGNLNEEAVIADALELVVMRDMDEDSANDVYETIAQILSTFSTSPVREEANEVLDSLDRLGYKPSGATAAWLSSLHEASALFAKVDAHWTAVIMIVNLIIAMSELRSNSPHFSFANATMKQLGLR